MRLLAAGLALIMAAPALAISPEAKEFIEISRKLEPNRCEKAKLTRELAVAEVERNAERIQALRAAYAKIDRDREAAAMERKLRRLEPLILDRDGKARRPEDLDAISLARREAFYRCK